MRKLVKIGISLGFLATRAGLAFAQDITITKPEEVRIINIGTLISAGIGIAMIGAALLAFAYLVWGGFEWITSGGDKAGMEAARNRITAALVGLVIVAAAWAITKLIETFFGITILGNITIPRGYE